LDEIEVVLGSHTDVQEAVVFPVPDGEGSQVIEAVVKAYEDSPLEAEPSLARELKTYVAGRLPRYSVPSRIEVIDDVPRTSNGKADRVTLIEQAARRGA
jgi:acyl-CoA synthetase (AMP-forming)/AMP-acid ligase II